MSLMKSISINDSQAVFGKNECLYQCVLDDFENTEFIGIITYNISSKSNGRLVNALKTACMNGKNAVVVTNIPKRFSSYRESSYAFAAKRMIDSYMRQLNPQDYGMKLSPYFYFSNHAKIVMTDNIIYWGSSNFSDESSGNLECGSISTDKELIKYVKETLFPYIQSNSVPYYQYNFTVAILNLEELIPACEAARERLFEAAFEPWADYDTNFEEKWVYRTTDSGLTIKFLRGFLKFFSRFDEALNIIDTIIEEHSESKVLPEQVEELKSLFEEYNQTYKSFNDTISTLFNDLEQVAQYDVADEACRKIVNDYGMEAYDENLDYYAQVATDEAAGEYEEIIKDSEQTVRDAIDSLDAMVQYFEQLKTSLYRLLEFNRRIDNTGVR